MLSIFRYDKYTLLNTILVEQWDFFMCIYPSSEWITRGWSRRSWRSWGNAWYLTVATRSRMGWEMSTTFSGLSTTTYWGSTRLSRLKEVAERQIYGDSTDAQRIGFDHYCISCKLSDKDIQNRIFETIPSNLADQIVIDLIGTENKDAIFAKIKSAVVKKRSIFLYR